MTQQETWEIFDEEEEALSLSDLPLAIRNEAAGGDDDDGQHKSSDVADDFEFRISTGGGLLSTAAEAADMCAADEVFFQGQILPLRPSVSSDNCLSTASRGPSRCGSRSESTEWHSAAVLSLGFDTSRSNSSSSSSCVSRSHSSNSHSSSGTGAGTCDPPRLFVSNNFYSHPSPTPRVRIVRKVNTGRRSTSSEPAGWGIFRLGVAKVPEIELYDLRSRRSNSGGRKSNADVDCAVKHALGDKAGAKAMKLYSTKSSMAGKSHESHGVEAKGDQKKKAPRVMSGFGLSCKCSPDAVEPSPASKAVITRKKKEELASLKRGESVGRSSRMFEWLEELSTAKAAAAGGSS